MKKALIRQTNVILAVLVTIGMNGLANALPLNGLMTGEISDRFDVLFVPAGYVFAIWGVIYLGLILYAIFQALPAQRTNPRLDAIAYPFVFSCAANVAWLFLWHYEQFPLTMLALLGLLIFIYLRLGVGVKKVPVVERWLVHVPFSIYLGWITVATIANVTTVLDYIGWDGWGLAPEAWAIIMLVVGLLVTAAVRLTRNDIAYALVIIWAFAGIGVKQAAVSSVATTAWIAAGAVLLLLLGGLLARPRSDQLFKVE
jgi:translocator protein